MLGRILLIILVLCSNTAFAMGDHCKVSNLGWHFYCDPEKEAEEEIKEEVKEELPQSVPVANSPEDYLARRDAVRKELQWKAARAILEPTNENIIDYIRTQRDKALNPSNVFTEKWKRALWTTPDLDYSLKRPVSTIGKQVWVDKQNIVKAKSIHKLNERYGVFFFYQSTCIYCQRYAPILREFANKHGVKVMAVTLDGGILSAFPDSVQDSGQSMKFGIAGKPVPATILFDKESKRIIPVGFGLMAMDELENRIYMMTQVEEGNAY